MRSFDGKLLTLVAPCNALLAKLDMRALKPNRNRRHLHCGKHCRDPCRGIHGSLAYQIFTTARNHYIVVDLSFVPTRNGNTMDLPRLDTPTPLFSAPLEKFMHGSLLEQTVNVGQNSRRPESSPEAASEIPCAGHEYLHRVEATASCRGSYHCATLSGRRTDLAFSCNLLRNE